MRKEIADAWVAALRSGKYPQTQGKLHDEGGYCCLGVLCEIAVASGLDLDVAVHSYGECQTYTYDTDDVGLPDRVVEWSRVTSSDPAVLYAGARHQLSGLNDDENLTFNEIADLIEQHWQSL